MVARSRRTSCSCRLSPSRGCRRRMRPLLRLTPSRPLASIYCRIPCRKVPNDLTKGTCCGAIISIITLLSIVILFAMELIAYLSVSTSTTITVDKSPDGELLHINFDISFPKLSCEFTSVDLNDVLGTKRFNVTTSIHKYSIDSNLKSTGKFYSAPIPRITNHGDEEDDDGYGSLSLTVEDFDRYSKLRDILVVNFYTSWSDWSSQLKPSWEKVATIIRERYDPKWAGILMAKVDCGQEAELCRRYHIQAYPTIRIFRRRNEIEENLEEFDQETYYGDRDTETLLAQMETLIQSVPREVQTSTDMATVDKLKRRPAPQSGGCRVEGWVQVKRVPGNLVFSARSPVHSFDASQINMSHVISHFSFGKTLSSGALKEMKRLTPYLGASYDHLSGQSYMISDNLNGFNDNITIEHYLQLVKSELHSRDNKLVEEYEYTAHSSTSRGLEVPVVKFHFEPSAMQVIVTEVPKSLSHFITNLCAIIGGIFTVGGILDSIFHNTNELLKKVELGKHM